ncbi:MAG TPA: hypothetical protein VIA18_05690 [Polyangia bacterium]|nr:hypothetical protein [Polyangia bacterium]
MVTSAELLKLRDRLLSLTQLASARCLRAPSSDDDNRQLVLDLEAARTDLLGFLDSLYRAEPTTDAESGDWRQLLADTKSTADRLLEASRVVLELARRQVAAN